jgi:hypothetical protein
LFALVFQISAFDHHWHPTSDQIYGVPGTSQHQLHCHGEAHGCANSGMDMPATLSDEGSIVALGVMPSIATPATDLLVPADAEIAVEKEPPRI